MGSGTVKYKAQVSNRNLDIYPGTGAKQLSVTQSGSFPSSEYKITKAMLTYNVGCPAWNSDSSGRVMQVSRVDGNSVVHFGSVPMGKKGKQTASLNTSVGYDGIKKLKFDGVDRWVGQLLGGSSIELDVSWEVTAPVVVPPPTPYPSYVITGTENNNGKKDTAAEASVSVSIEGVDISESVNKYLLSMTYTDNEEDETDDLQIKLQDQDGQWLKTWLNDILQAAAAGKYSQTTTKTGTYTINDKRASIRNVVSRGSCMYDCMMAQIYLNLLGYFKGTINGKAGDDTVSAVKAFQKAQKLSQSGTINRTTWNKLTNAVNGKDCTKYTCIFKNSADIQVYEKANTSKKLFVMKKGTECIITDKVASGWYACTFGDKSGYCKGSNVTANRSVAEVIKTKTTTKGLTIKAGITFSEQSGRIRKMNCGSFELDSIKASGPPATVTIKGTSLPYGNGVRTEERDKAWEGYTVSKIGREIAQKAGLGFLYDAPKDPSYSRIEQAKQTDIAFLQEICHKNGLSLKVSGQKLIIFDQARYEAMVEVASILWMDGTYKKWDLSTQEGDVHYDECIVRYYHPEKKKTIEGSSKADDYDEKADEHLVLKVTNQRVNSESEAKELAEKLLRLHNKYEKKCSFTLIGNPMLGAGLTARLKGFGLFSTKYIIKQCKHEVGSNGYTTKITLRTIPDKNAEKITASKTNDSGGGSGSSGGSKSGNNNKTWKTTKACTVYKAATGNTSVGSLAKGVKVTLLGSTKNGRTYISGGGKTGYVPSGCIGKV